MNDNVTDVQEVAETKAVVTVKEFVATGETRDITITSLVDDDTLPNKVLSITFGRLVTTKDGEVTSEVGRYSVEYPRVIDGMVDNLVVMAAKADKAVDLAIVKSGRGTSDEYHIDVDFDDEFYKQVVAAPKVDKDNVWTNDKFDGNREQLMMLAGDAEGVLGDTAEGEKATQAQYLELAKILTSAYELVGRSRPALVAWAKGNGTSNLPLLKKLGSGANSLTEAMFLSSLTADELAVTPATTTSGKSLVRHRLISLDAAVALVPMGKEITTFGEDEKWDEVAVNAFLDQVAIKVYGVDNATSLGSEELVAAVDNAAHEKATKFAVEFGKNINTYNSKEYDYAKLTFARVSMSSMGSTCDFGTALTMAQEVAAKREDGDVEGAEKRLNALLTKNTLVSKGMKACLAHAKAVAQEKRNVKLRDEVEKGDGGPISEKATVSFGKLPAIAAAAHLFKLMHSHSESDAVYEQLVSLHKQFKVTAVKEKDAA